MGDTEIDNRIEQDLKAEDNHIVKRNEFGKECGQRGHSDREHKRNAHILDLLPDAVMNEFTAHERMGEEKEERIEHNHPEHTHNAVPEIEAYDNKANGDGAFYQFENQIDAAASHGLDDTEITSIEGA